MKKWEVSEEVLEFAIRKISRNKAMGLDKLPDYFIKNHEVLFDSRRKIKDLCQKWVDGEELPTYMKTGRIFALSKDDTSFPELGNVRTISILPSIMKLYELVLLQFIKQEVAAKNLIPQNQRGFVESYSTYDNIIDLLLCIS